MLSIKVTGGFEVSNSDPFGLAGAIYLLDLHIMSVSLFIFNCTFSGFFAHFQFDRGGGFGRDRNVFGGGRRSDQPFERRRGGYRPAALRSVQTTHLSH